MTIQLPIEIINKIFLFLKSDTSDVIKSSKFYNSSFPILFLNTRKITYDRPLSKLQLQCLAFYQYDVYWKILENQNTNCVSKYKLFHIFTNDENKQIYSEDTQIDLIYKYNQFLIFLKKYEDNYDIEMCCGYPKTCYLKFSCYIFIFFFFMYIEYFLFKSSLIF